MVNRKVSSAEDDREAELMNVELDRKHYGRLVMLAAMWKGDSPSRMVEGIVDDLWTQRGEFIPEDLTLEDFDGARKA